MKLTNKTMRTILAAVFSVLIIACGTGKENENLTALYHQRDSLKLILDNTTQKLKEVEESIAALDTTIAERLVLVSTQLLEPQKFDHYIEVQGVVESDKNITINSEINGVVRSIRVSKGDLVKKDQVLIVLDSDLIQKNIDEVETSYDLANNIFQRQEKLWKQNIGSEIQYLEAKNRKEALELKLKTLKAQKAMATVKAPFDGVVDEVFSKEGEMASPMMPLLRLINGYKMFTVADVSETHIKTVKAGTNAIVKVPALDLELDSKISRVGQYINPYNRTFRVQVDLDNKTQILKPNLLSVIYIKVFEADSAIVLPSSAIQQDPAGIEYVYIVDRKNPRPFAKRVDIKTGLTTNNKTHITEGLNGSEEVITEGARGLKENERIEISN
jgi:membrane fusion protein, multidrug efflux system